MRINHNINAMNTYNKLASNTGLASNALQKLSSGLRINSASDDAAGLAISEKMRGQIRGLNQASRNIQDGISLVQTAEGALKETHALLQRGRELSVQAANGTYTDLDKQNIQDEINQIKSEIDRISNTTQFNTITLLNKAGGASVADKQTVIDNLQKGWLAAAEQLVSDTYGLDGGGADITIELVDSIDGAGGTLAQVSTTLGGSAGPGSNIKLQIDMSDFATMSSWPNGGTDPNNYGDRTIAHEMTHAIMDASINVSTGMEAWFMEGTAEAAHGADERLNSTLSSLTEQQVADLIGTGSGVAMDSSDKYSMAFAAVRYMDYLIKNNGGTGVKDVLQAMNGDQTLTLNDAIAGNADLFAAGVTDVTSFATLFKSAGGGVNYITSTLAPELLNTDTGSLTGSDVTGGAIKTADTIIDESLYGTATTDPLVNFNEIWPTITSSLSSAGVSILGGANSGQSLNVWFADAGTSAIGLTDVDVTVDASAAISSFDSAIQTISGYRAGFGAIQNRLEHALAVNSNSSENLTSSESRIRDVDMAEEMMSFTKANILSQSAQAMLAQVNQQPQGVLKLLAS